MPPSSFDGTTPDALADAFDTACREGRHADAIVTANRLLTLDPTRAAVWAALRGLPLFENAEAAGVARWLPVTRDRVPTIVEELLGELKQAYHPTKLLILAELARLCGVPLPVGEICKAAGVPVLVRPLRIPPQDFDESRRLRIDAHPYQPWVHTHNRPDSHRKNQHPLVPFVHVPGLQVARTPSPDKPECGFVLFDGDHGLIAQDTMWAGLGPSAKMLTPLSSHAVLSFGWTPDRTIDGPAVFIPNRENYYHFLVESLPAAVIAAGTPALAGYKLVFARLSSWQREALALARIPEDRILELETLHPAGRDTDYLRFTDAWVPVDLPFALACAISREALPVPRKMRRGERLFITRGGGGHVIRRLENEDEVLAALASRGFTPVIAEHLSFREQAERFGRAEMVAGAHGAGLTNMIHAPQQATLIELINTSCHNEQAMNFSSMQRITQCNGQGYIRIVGAERPGQGAGVFPPNRAYAVDIADVLRAVDTAEQNYRYTVYPE